MPVSKLMPGAEPFFHSGGSTGVLLLHGLSASVQEVAWLGEHLHKAGHTVHAPRLYGHGITADHMLRMRWQDWYYSALDGYHLLCQHCDRVVIAGFSMGGALALRLASEVPSVGVVAMAAAFWLPVTPRWLPSAARFIRPYIATYDQSTDKLHHTIMDMQRQRGEPVTGRVAYYRQSAVGVAQLLRLQEELAVVVYKISAPALLIYSHKDRTIPFDNMVRLAAALKNSPSIQQVELYESDHIITNDVDHQQVFDAVTTFVNNLSTPSA